VAIVFLVGVESKVKYSRACVNLVEGEEVVVIDIENYEWMGQYICFFLLAGKPVLIGLTWSRGTRTSLIVPFDTVPSHH
jgi:hypothetical protein